jgi:hypothetical protein
MSDAVLAKAKQTTEADPLEKLIADEERVAADQVLASGLSQDEKVDTLNKLKIGELTPQGAIDIADMFPPSRTKSSANL